MIYHETEHGIAVLADCMDYMATMADKSVDLCLTDPPYGIGADAGFGVVRGFGGIGTPIASRCYDDVWDCQRPNKSVFDAIINKSKLCLVFGGNYFADILPSSTHWLVWDKLNTMPTFSDCELVWTNSKRKSVMKYVHEYNGLIGKEQKRVHPTQKPVALFSWCLNNYSKAGDTIFDPFAGSFTTAIACIRTGRKYICIEKEPKYFEIGVKRIETELAQTDIFRED